MLTVNKGSRDAQTALRDLAKLRKRAPAPSSPQPRPFEGIFSRISPEKKRIGNGNATAVRACPYGGLKNEGATCYLNSVLQTLFHLKAFRRAVYAVPTERHKPGEKMSVVLALQRLFCRMQMQGESGKATSGVELLASFGWDENDMLVQQDVAEFINIFFERIEESMQDKEYIKNMYGIGQEMVDRVHKPADDLQNQWTRTRKDPPQWPLVINEVRDFNSIRAVREHIANPELIDGFDTSGDMQDLEKDLNKALASGENDRAEELRKKLADMSPLERGFGKVDLQRRCLFSLLPPVLMVNLQRIQYCPLRNSAFKINSRFEFEEDLDLEPFCVPGSFDPLRPPKYRYMYSQKFSICGLYIVNTLGHSLLRISIHRLFSVIVHSGYTQVGHYSCFLRPEMRQGSNKAEWFKFDGAYILKRCLYTWL